MLDCQGCLPVMSLPSAMTALGVGRRGLLRLLEAGVLERLSRRAVAGRCVIERAATDPLRAHEVRLRMLLVGYDDCVASHDSAALLLGLPLLDHPSVAVATRPAGAWRGGPDTRVRIAPLPPHHVQLVDGLRCTTPARTVVDVARCSSLRGAVVTGDAALRRGCSAAELAAMLEETAAWSDIGKPRHALRFLDPRSESPLESVSRVVMHEREVPPPELQAAVTGADGVTYRVDFWWRRQRVAGEADGLAKYDDRDVLRAEKVRQEALERAGVRVVRWGWRDILHESDVTITRICRALRG